MTDKSVKVDPEIHRLVDEHTQKNGSKIGKFFEIAAKEKLQRDAQGGDNVVLQRYGREKETK